MWRSIILNTAGPATVQRSFRMTIGLDEEYGRDKIHLVQEVEKIIGEWLVMQKETGRPYLPGEIRASRILYARGKKCRTKAVVIYEGNANVLDGEMVLESNLVTAFRELAEIFMEKLMQFRIYLTYMDKCYVFQNVKKPADQ